MFGRIGRLLRSAVARAAGLRVVATGLGLVASIAIARLGGPEVKGVSSAFAALLSVSFLFLNFDIPQQALRMARRSGQVDHVLPWMRRVWWPYLALFALVAGLALFVDPLVSLVALGVLVNVVQTQTGVITVGTRGPVVYAWSVVLQQAAMLGCAVVLGLTGTLTPVTAYAMVIVSVAAPIAVMWFQAPRSVFSSSEFAAPVLAVARGGALWQVIRSMQTIMQRMDLLWVTAVLGAASAGIYSVAISTAMLVNLVPAQVSNQLMAAILRGTEFSWRRSAGQALLSGVAFAVPLGVAAPWLIPLVYGDSFRGAANATLIALVGAVAWGVVQVASNYIRNLGRRTDYVLATVPGFVTMTIGLALLVPAAGILGGALSMALGLVVYAVAGCLVCRRVEKRIG